MKPCNYRFDNQVNIIRNYMNDYLKQKIPDVILYSTISNPFRLQFRVHKEVFGQTDFMQEILKNTKEYCCEILKYSNNSDALTCNFSILRVWQ